MVKQHKLLKLYRFSRVHPIMFVLAIAGLLEMGIGSRAASWGLTAFGFMGLLTAIAIWVNRKNPPWPFHRQTPQPPKPIRFS